MGPRPASRRSVAFRYKLPVAVEHGSPAEPCAAHRTGSAGLPPPGFSARVTGSTGASWVGSVAAPMRPSPPPLGSANQRAPSGPSIGLPADRPRGGVQPLSFPDEMLSPIEQLHEAVVSRLHYRT